MRTWLISSCLILLSLPAFGASPELTARLLENRLARMLPAYSAPELEYEPSAETVEARGEIVAVEDGRVMMAFVVSQEAQAALVERGASLVSAKEELRDNAVFEGKWFRVYRADPKMSGLESIEWMVGKSVRAVLKPSLLGRYLLVAVEPV